MSAELIDARTRITELTDAVLDVQHRITGKDRSELMREALHDWATRYEHGSSLLHKEMERRGIKGSGRE